VRPLDGQAPVDDELDDVHYGFAWAMDSRHFFYTRVDDAMRPGSSGATNSARQPEPTTRLQEDDEQYNVSVGRSRDDAVIACWSARR
jgi:oligopeptidase B